MCHQRKTFPSGCKMIRMMPKTTRAPSWPARLAEQAMSAPRIQTAKVPSVQPKDRGMYRSLRGALHVKKPCKRVRSQHRIAMQVGPPSAKVQEATLTLWRSAVQEEERSA